MSTSHEETPMQRLCVAAGVDGLEADEVTVRTDDLQWALKRVDAAIRVGVAATGIPAQAIEGMSMTEVAAELLDVPLAELDGWMQQHRAMADRRPAPAAPPATDTAEPAGLDLRTELGDIAGRILLEVGRLRHITAGRILLGVGRLRHITTGKRGSGWRALNAAASTIESGALAVRSLSRPLTATEAGMNLPGFSRKTLVERIPMPEGPDGARL